HHAVETRSRELESARAFLERVLANLSAGVLVLDAQFRLVTANHGAGRILMLPLATHLGEPLESLVPQLAERIERGFADQRLAATPTDSWQQQVELARANTVAHTDALVLLVRGSRLPLEDGPGYVIVFDDITQLISAQRTLAWSEVARRLAHEIKNPLTPIQLAAERLHMKLGDQLPADQAHVLTRATTTIVNQVNALKRMVDEFREYARLPAAHLAPLDLNALITEVAGLYGASDTPARASSHTAVVLHLDPQLPKIWADSEQLRQVLHNLLGNAKEAMQSHLGTEAGQILIRTNHDQAASTPEAGASEHVHVVRLTVEDEGPGFPAHILRRAFEPYVTTKPSGTGLGLAMVKKIIDEHDARIELANRKATTTLGSAGASVSIVFRRIVSDAALADPID
nr:ATP-binding protein [Burkholderiaceae bacterium]